MAPFIFDGHCDAILKTYLKRNHLRDPQWQVNKELRHQGGVRIQVYAIFIPPPMNQSPLGPALDMVALVHQMIGEDSDYYLIRDESDFDHLRNSSQLGVLIGLEGAEPLGPDTLRLPLFYQLGVRLITMTWSRRNFFADGSYWNPDRDSNHGLTAEGRDLVEAMNELGMVIDVSHLNDQGFYEVMELTEKPPMASHSNARALCSSPRNLTDDQIKTLVEKDGVMGINFFPGFLTEEDSATVEDVIHHIDYICNLTGSARHVGLGADFDGISSTPEGLENAGKMKDLILPLEQKGYSQEDIEAILSRNMERVFRDNFTNTIDV